MQGELCNTCFFARHGLPRRQRQRLFSDTAETTAPSTLARRPRVVLIVATSSTGREPTANGRAAQVMLRALAMGESAPRLETRAGLLSRQPRMRGKLFTDAHRSLAALRLPGT
jgi:hypothetical protein